MYDLSPSLFVSNNKNIQIRVIIMQFDKLFCLAFALPNRLKMAKINKSDCTGTFLFPIPHDCFWCSRTFSHITFFDFDTAIFESLLFNNISKVKLLCRA